MLVLNKYLRELGINEDTWPFNEIAENVKAFENGEPYDGRYVEKAPLKDGTIDEGFINAETFNMDTTLAMIIYSYLCYFRDNCMDFGVPGYLTMKNGKDMGIEYGSKKWYEIVNAMITGFRMYIMLEEESPRVTDYKEYSEWKRAMAQYTRKMNYGIRLFAKHFSSLNW